MVNESLVHRNVTRKDITSYMVPTTELAIEVGQPRGANMIMLGALLEATGIVKPEIVYDTLVKTFKNRYLDKMPGNMKAIDKGREFIRQYQARLGLACGQ